MRRIILNRRREQRNAAINDSNALRTKYLPHVISLFAIGITIMVFRIVFATFSSEISSGNIKNNEIIGPVEVNGTSLYNLSVEHNLNRYSNNWCSLSMLLLDENKNYITGASKDLYYERDRDGSYSESNAEYSIVIKKPGIYYFTINSKYSKNENESRSGFIKMRLNKVYLGTNYLTNFAIALIVLGGFLILYLFHDWEITEYIPPMSSKYSSSIYKKFLFAGAIILLVFIYSGITYDGYAGTNSIYDAPSSMFSNNNNHYFGR